MGYWESVFDKIFLIFTMYIAIVIFAVPIAWRKDKIPFFVLCVAGLVGFCFLAELTRNLTMGASWVTIFVKNAIEILLIVSASASTLLIKKYGKGSFFFVGVAAYAAICIADNINDLCFLTLHGPDGLLAGIGPVAENIVRAVIVVVIYAVTYAVCWAVFIRRRGKSVEFNANKSVIALFILIFCTNLFISDITNLREISPLIITKILSYALVLCVLYNQSNYINSREENARLEQMLNQQTSQYETSKLIIEQLNVKAHDLKHFVEVYQSHGEVPDEMLTGLKGVSGAYENLFYTGNKALDITLTEKCSMFGSNNIEFSVLADGELISFMSDVDVYVLFGNLLENARDAVLREDPDNRVIGLYLKKAENYVSLHIENTCTHAPEFLNGMPLTSKDDKINHGFGTKSIQLVVLKYGGTMNLSCNDKMFTADIVFFTN